ncbi:hypothetical protein Scep_025195 [Stephania cephalantha]|uniref:Reverse transcriptase n=1 Tax=Stephania cephalantha TaxID=152367 RepID=A0AAP0EHT4_9MAGN
MLDSVLIASDTVEFAIRRHCKGYVMKLDFSKAYDCVDWQFLEFKVEKETKRTPNNSGSFC